MCADADVGVVFLGWVVYCSDVGHGVRGDGIEVVFWKLEGEGEDGEHAFGEGEHVCVVVIYGGTEEGCGRGDWPLIAGSGGTGGNRAVLFGVGGVFAH